MFLGIDVGGTKTIVAILEDSGVITESQRFPTPQNYEQFISKLADTVGTFTTKEFKAVGVGVPATKIDRMAGTAISFANLAWDNAPVQIDIEKLIGCPVAIENDAKLAGLSESMLRDPMRLLYLTVSTGIGYSLIVNRKIDPNIGDSGGRLMFFEHGGKLLPWERFASGKAIVETYGKQAKDIDDPATWNKIARNIMQGLIELIAVTEPDLVVVGGSVGEYLDRFIKPLTGYLKNLETPLLKMPRVEAAKRPDEAVVYGCYDYAKEVFGL
jgi:glucokinase